MFPRDWPARPSSVIKGDARSQSIAAASIVAKVTRDRLMRRLALAYPDYGFDAHKGYGTALHAASIARHGPSPYHRLSFAPFARDDFEAVARHVRQCGPGASPSGSHRAEPQPPIGNF